MPRYRVTGTVASEVSVEVEADSMDEAIDKADLAPSHAHIVWDATKLWHDAEVIEDAMW